MGRDWSKQRRRDQVNQARRDEIDESRYFAELAAPTTASRPLKGIVTAESGPGQYLLWQIAK